MKYIGFLMVTIGFIAAALATVVDVETIKWVWYIPALAFGIAGVVIIKVDDASQHKTEHHVAARIETVEGSLEKIVTNIKQLNSDKDSINTYDMRHRVDELLTEDMINFVQARQSIVGKYGLQAYADLMGYFASGERYINRVWSASADGYIDEVNMYLDKAQKQFIGALENFNRLAIMQE